MILYYIKKKLKIVRFYSILKIFLKIIRIIDPNFNFDEVFYSNEKNDIQSTCLNCGYTENISDFIYDEMSRKKYHFKINKRVSTLYCRKYDKESTIPSSFLK